MKKFLCIIWIAAAWLGVDSAASAQTTGTVIISPANPTSADTIVVRYMVRFLGTRFVRDAYRTSMTDNRIRLTLGEVRTDPVIDPGLTFPIDMRLGPLPAGNYVVDLYTAVANQADVAVSLNHPLTVSDDRVTKSAPYVRLNYSDQWWKPSESGWGLFIWHGHSDQVMAAWFTYGADGKAAWYTIQLGRWTSFSTYEGQVIQSTGPSFLNFAAGSTVGVQAVGTAKLVFSDANNGTFSYTIQNVTQSKDITRFRP